MDILGFPPCAIAKVKVKHNKMITNIPITSEAIPIPECFVLMGGGGDVTGAEHSIRSLHSPIFG